MPDQAVFISGVPVRIIEINGAPATSLGQLTAHDPVTIKLVLHDGSEHIAMGSPATDVESGTGSVHEKSDNGTGKAVRRWGIRFDGEQLVAILGPS